MRGKLPLDDLEGKLKNIVSTISSRLEAGEMTQQVYVALVEEQLAANGMLTKETPVSDSVGRMVAILEEKLKIKWIPGLNDVYMRKERSPISPTAQHDMDQYQTLKLETFEYLRKTIGKKPVTKDEFGDAVSEFFASRYDARIDNNRRGFAIAMISEALRREFVIKEKSRRIGRYEVNEVLTALSRI